MADSINIRNENIMNIMRLKLSRIPTLLFFGILLSGCATSQNRQDPYESMNRSVFSFNEKADKYALKPVAQGYKTVAPEPIQIMAGNFFSNLDDVVVVINDLLQLKFSEAGSDGSRLLINTVLGMGGLVDFGSDYGFPKRYEDFGQTLAHYGVSSGPYIVVPLLGGYTVRSGAGGLVDIATNPIFYAAPFMAPFVSPLIGAGRAVDERKQVLDKEEIINEAALDKYEFLRDAYLQRRNSLIHDGNPPPRSIDDEIDAAIDNEIIDEPVQEAVHTKNKRSAVMEDVAKKKRSVVIEYID
jgi:phospholipid-binding lipoprotein MlaA